MPSLRPDGSGRRVAKNGTCWIVKSRRLAIYLRDGFLCAYCGTDLHAAAPREITLDHLTPQCQGGGHESRNLITACLSCNSSRQATPWRQYATAGAVERILRLRRRQPNLALARAILAGTLTLAQVRAERC